jgi:hypothetical protein
MGQVVRSTYSEFACGDGEPTEKAYSIAAKNCELERWDRINLPDVRAYVRNHGHGGIARPKYARMYVYWQSLCEYLTRAGASDAKNDTGIRLIAD